MTNILLHTSSGRTSTGRSTSLYLLALVVVFVGTVALVGPSGDFPLNDDWSYAIATRTLVATGAWHPTGWTSMPLITNALWAAPICAASSCSFNDLRLTTLLASLLFFSATFFLVRVNCNRNALPLLSAILVAFNPIVYTLSFTFMADVLFSALLTLSILFFFLSIEQDSVLLAVLGTILALAATMSRQLGLCVPVGYLIVRMLQPGHGRRKYILAFAPFILCAASLALFNGWLRETGRIPLTYYAPLQEIVALLQSPVKLILRISYNLVEFLLYLGLFSSPVLVLTTRPAVVAKTQSWVRNGPLVVAAAATLICAVCMIARRQIMPLGMNMLIPQGIGPLTLRDAAILDLPNVPALPSIFWICVTLISLWGTFELVARVAIYATNTVSTRRYRNFSDAEAGILLAVVSILAYITPLLATRIFDRYFIPLLPLVLFFLVHVSAADSVKRYRMIGSAALCLMTAGFAVLTTHDYMAWNRARWRAIADLQNSGDARPTTLDGGLEYNGLFSYNPFYQIRDGKSWWWIDKDNYQITFGPIPGMKIFNEYPYEVLLPPVKRSILVLKR